MGRLRNSIINKYVKAVDNAREALSSEITIYYRTGEKITCSTCDWDYINKESTDPDCPECGGNYYWDVITSKTINATTSWAGLSSTYTPIHLAAGDISVNDVIITCKLTDVLVDAEIVSGDTYFDNKYIDRIDIDGILVYPKTSPFKYGLAGYLYSCALVATKDSNR